MRSLNLVENVPVWQTPIILEHCNWFVTYVQMSALLVMVLLKLVAFLEQLVTLCNPRLNHLRREKNVMKPERNV